VMSDEPLHVQDSRRPVVQLIASPDLCGNWSLELQAVYLDRRKVVKRGSGAGKSAAGIVAGFLELLQEAHEQCMPDLPIASRTLWTVARAEAEE
ncbi:MAG: hypothetical protein K2W93_12145, partial [Burkholderiaceae bacterium]|nr:hypothetical protein [Burkholderiaceae bacterium]